jgi:hypothetical protein
VLVPVDVQDGHKLDKVNIYDCKEIVQIVEV